MAWLVNTTAQAPHEPTYFYWAKQVTWLHLTSGLPHGQKKTGTRNCGALPSCMNRVLSPKEEEALSITGPSFQNCVFHLISCMTSACLYTLPHPPPQMKAWDSWSPLRIHTRTNILPLLDHAQEQVSKVTSIQSQQPRKDDAGYCGNELICAHNREAGYSPQVLPVLSLHKQNECVKESLSHNILC